MCRLGWGVALHFEELDKGGCFSGVGTKFDITVHSAVISAAILRIQSALLLVEFCSIGDILSTVGEGVILHLSINRGTYYPLLHH